MTGNRIIETITRSRPSVTHTAAMVAGPASDVACYVLEGLHSGADVAEHGAKMTHQAALRFGFQIPSGWTYRR